MWKRELIIERYKNDKIISITLHLYDFRNLANSSLAKNIRHFTHIFYSEDKDPYSVFSSQIGQFIFQFNTPLYIPFYGAVSIKNYLLKLRERERIKKIETIKVNNKNAWIAREIKNKWTFFALHVYAQHNNQKVHKYEHKKI